MPRDIRKYLWDVELAIKSIASFTKNRTQAEYLEDDLLRSAVERKFEIVGEALTQIRIHHQNEFMRLTGTGPFISFRNILAHQYAELSDSLVWEAVKSEQLLLLRTEVLTRLEELGPSKTYS